jgi:hypothetical protein
MIVSEAERVDRLLWPGNYTDAQYKEAQEKLGTSPQGTGRLWVRNYKISPAPKSPGDRNLGQIDWIRFDVRSCCRISLKDRRPRRDSSDAYRFRSE